MFDHVTIRVSDLAAIRPGHEEPGHVQVRFADGSFSFIEGTPR